MYILRGLSPKLFGHVSLKKCHKFLTLWWGGIDDMVPYSIFQVFMQYLYSV